MTTFVKIKRENVCKMLSAKYCAWHTVGAQEYNVSSSSSPNLRKPLLYLDELSGET